MEVHCCSSKGVGLSRVSGSSLGCCFVSLDKKLYCSTLSFSTQICKIMRWTSIPFRGNSNTPSCSFSYGMGGGGGGWSWWILEKCHLEIVCSHLASQFYSNETSQRKFFWGDEGMIPPPPFHRKINPQRKEGATITNILLNSHKISRQGLQPLQQTLFLQLFSYIHTLQPMQPRPFLLPN